MALSIPKTLLDISSEVTLHLDTSNLSKVTYNRIERYLRTGIIEGNGAAAQVALALRKGNKLPFVHLGVRWMDFLYIQDIDAFYDAFDRAIALIAIGEPPHVNQSHWVKNLRSISARQSDHGQLHMPKKYQAPFHNLQLPAMAMPTGNMDVRLWTSKYGKV